MAKTTSPSCQSPGKIAAAKAKDHPAKSVLKAVSWRIVGTLYTIFISYIITGRIDVAVTIGSVEAITKVFLFYLHERAWERMPRHIPLGRLIRYRFLVLRRRFIAPQA